MSSASWAQVCFLILVSIAAYSQENEVVRGKIVDSKTNAPIPFATIRLKTETGITGVVSNSEGDFQFPARYKSLTDSIIISCIGYANKQIPMSEVSESRLNLITLKESTIQLTEVTVRAKRERRNSADRIVTAAIERIPMNFPASPHSYLAYYRDYQIEEKEYINLNEAILEVFDSGFQADDQQTTNMSLLDYRKNSDFKRDSATAIAYDNSKGHKFIPDATLYPFGGNELAILRIHDALRNYKTLSYSYVYNLSENFVNNHFFKIEGISYLNQVPLYQISFHTRISVTGYQHFAKGEIYIEPENFAIHKLEYTAYEKGKPESRVLYNIQLEYSRANDRMALNYISFSNFFKVKNPKDFTTKDILINWQTSEIAIIFNNKPEKQSALEKGNYDIRFDDKKLEIAKVQINTQDDHLVHVSLQNPLPARDLTPAFNKRIKVELRNIKDTEGREINKKTYVNVNQYRELFVQAESQYRVLPDSLLLQKNKPLPQSSLRKEKSLNSSNYWMNTPLKKE